MSKQGKRKISTRKLLESLEWYLLDAVHDFGQAPTEAVMSAFYKWANTLCPGFAEEYGFLPWGAFNA